MCHPTYPRTPARWDGWHSASGTQTVSVRGPEALLSRSRTASLKISTDKGEGQCGGGPSVPLPD